MILEGLSFGIGVFLGVVCMFIFFWWVLKDIGPEDCLKEREEEQST